MVLLGQLVATSAAVAATRSRKAKVTAIAALLGGLDVTEIPAATAFLAGELPGGRPNVGWSTLAGVQPPPAPEPRLTVSEVDRLIDAIRAAGDRNRAEIPDASAGR